MTSWGYLLFSFWDDLIDSFVNVIGFWLLELANFLWTCKHDGSQDFDVLHYGTAVVLARPCQQYSYALQYCRTCKHTVQNIVTAALLAMHYAAF